MCFVPGAEIAARRRRGRVGRTAVTTAEAVSRFARYCTGMRSERTSGISPSWPILPACAANWIGESGGTYQTIGSVRYSGCSGNATFHSIAIL